MNPRLIEHFFRPFLERDIFFATTLAVRMKEFGVTAQDIIDMVDAVVEQRKIEVEIQQDETERKMAAVEKAEIDNNLRCPKCGDALRIYPVNVSKCTDIGGPWKSSIMCRNEKCRYNELSTLTVKELRKQ